MKKLLLLFALLLASNFINVQAQESVRFGILAGANLGSNSLSGTKDKIGAQVAIKTEIPFSKYFYIDGSVVTIAKGYKTEVRNNLTKETTKNYLTNYYLEVPLHLGGRLYLGDNTSFFISGGPYASYALFGRVRSEIGKNNNTTDLYKSEGKHQKFDYGVGLKAGFELYKHIQLSVGYEHGLVNIAKDSKDYKNRNLALSCAYIF